VKIRGEIYEIERRGRVDGKFGNYDVELLSGSGG